MAHRAQHEMSNRFVRWELLCLLGIIALATSAIAGELRKFELPSQRGIFQQPPIQQQASPPPKREPSIYESFQQDVQSLSREKNEKLETSLNQKLEQAVDQKDFKQAAHLFKLIHILKNQR